MEENGNDIIKIGDHVIIQRQKYRKVHKFASETSILTLGNDKVELGSILHKRYSSTFKMISKPHKKNRIFTLEYVRDTILTLKADVEIKSSGSDNRNIQDDGKSQKLTTDEITALRSNKSSTGIVETLITNSNTFSSKTEYSQEKYLKKKEKKYFEYIQILKPTVLIIAEIMYRQGSESIMGLRIDALSQILNYSNIQGNGNFLLYETGTSGLLPAALLNALGCDTDANLIHLHPGTQFQEKALLMMNFTKAHRQRCKSVNVYSILRHYYQHFKKCDSEINNCKKEIAVNVDPESQRKRTLSNGSSEDTSNKVLKTNDEQKESDNSTSLAAFQNDFDSHLRSKNITEDVCNILEKKVDCLVIAVREHPLSVFKTLTPFVHPGRPFVIYSSLVEPLQDTYMALSLRKDVSNLRLLTNWMRGYQVLPERTHPDLQMNVNGGYLLTGFIVSIE